MTLRVFSIILCARRFLSTGLGPEKDDDMKAHGMTARIVGVLFVIGTVTGVLSGVFTAPVFGATDFPANIARDARPLVIGALLVLTMGFSLAMIPAVLYPVFRQIDEVLAVGAIVFRGVLEALSPIVTVLSWFLLISMSRLTGTANSADGTLLEILSGLALSVADWMSLVGAIAFSLGALIIYTLFYRARLIPRWLSVWGLVGAVLYIAAQVWGMLDPQQLPLTLEHGAGILMAPTALQEMVMAVWLIVKGFNPITPVSAQAGQGRRSATTAGEAATP